MPSFRCLDVSASPRPVVPEHLVYERSHPEAGGEYWAACLSYLVVTLMVVFSHYCFVIACPAKDGFAILCLILFANYFCIVACVRIFRMRPRAMRVISVGDQLMVQTARGQARIYGVEDVIVHQVNHVEFFCVPIETKEGRVDVWFNNHEEAEAYSCLEQIRTRLSKWGEGANKASLPSV